MVGISLPLNLEMAATLEMRAIALRHRPRAVCIVPEKREERTTEGGLEVARDENALADFILPLREAGCRVSMFIAADRRQIEASYRIGAPVIELHTGAYCDADIAGDIATRDAELARLVEMAGFARALGLEGAFDALYGFEDAGHVPKPHAAAFAAVFTLDGLDGRRAAMFEDDPRNLAVPHGLGMRTVLVGDAEDAPHVQYRTDDLVGFLGRIGG